MPRVAIVGAGLAGYTVARTLRAAGHEGEIVVVGAEAHRPYDRPPLSKAYLSGELDAAGIALEGDEEIGVGWRLGVAAVGLDAGTRALALSDGSVLGADEIVLAVGASPRELPELPGAPSGAPAHVLGTREHADALRAALVPGAEVVIAGAGFVGLEVAAAAIAAGAASVTVVCADTSPLRRFGAEASAAVRGLHERSGVRFVTGVRVVGVERSPDGRPVGVRLGDGRVAEGSVVVAGIGAVPSTGWLAGSGLALTPWRAVACDDRGRAAPGIHAAGDCAAWGEVSCGHWTLAREQASRAAEDIVAPGTAAASGEPPYVWSDQHGARVQFAGRLRGDETVSVAAGDVAAGDPLLVYRDSRGEEVAAFGIDQPRLMMRWRKTHRAVASPSPQVAAA
ncbi:FAD-dependent oxidoreductase [Microbacterium betulae]|uniref:FAD-dependent oxidoreductase n=1 Tax=Microbacterium betulae TaxID=2981139 RepID=A0AA97FH42_9MICO|nr:FAD-dependent oxidoreductase [Microbacterium sp. AB]WOF23451.1 FAD-dependent oxidoreductase [Microbacterium sp. AB]